MYVFCAKSAWICACLGISRRCHRIWKNIHANAWIDGCVRSQLAKLLPIYEGRTEATIAATEAAAAPSALTPTLAMVNTFGAVYFNYQQHIDVEHQKRVDVQSRQVKVHANQFPVFSFSFLFRFIEYVFAFFAVFMHQEQLLRLTACLSLIIHQKKNGLLSLTIVKSRNIFFFVFLCKSNVLNEFINTKIMVNFDYRDTQLHIIHNWKKRAK